MVRTALSLGLVALLLPFVTAPVHAEPEDGDAPRRTGARYQNREIGLTATGPQGWKISVDDGKSLQWTRLATWFDQKNKSDAVLSVRTRKAANLVALEKRVRDDWKDTVQQGVRVDSIRRIEPTALQPTPQVIVDAVHTATGKAPAPGRPAPTRKTHYRAVYFLAPGHELLLYIQSPESLWSRLRPAMDRLRNSIRFGGAQVDLPKGEGTYRDERNGLTCKYPKDYTVVLPKAVRHIARFEGVGADLPVVDIYRIPWDREAADDAARLETYYKDELAGEVTVGSAEIGGRQATLVNARATVQGVDQAVLLAVIKRGDHVIRLRVSAPQAQESALKSVFGRVAASLQLSQAR